MNDREAMAMWPFFEFSKRGGRWLLTLDPEAGGYIAFGGDSKADCWRRAIEWLNQRPSHNTSAW